MKTQHNVLQAALLIALVTSGCARADEPMSMPMPMVMPPTTMKHSDQKAPPIGSLPSSDGAALGTYADYGVALKMHDDPLLAKLQLDQLETVHNVSDGSNSVAWDGRLWLGRDLDKLWVRSEGDHGGDGIGEGDIEALWGHALTPFWDIMTGMRHDLDDGPTRNWAAIGVQGIAPYEFETEATFYVGPSGRSALRLKASQDWLFTQKLILMPEFDLNAYGRSDPERNIGAGLSDVSLGLRLRYEISRKFAPYIGVNWVRRVGTTAEYTQQNNQSTLDRQLIAGVHLWF